MRSLMITVLSVCFLGTVGCSSLPQSASLCSAPSDKTVNAYLQSATEKLERTSCSMSFDSYFSGMLGVSSDNPDSDNKEAFAKLIRTGIASGAISKRVGMQTFNEYFEPEFYALKTNVRSNCVALNDRATEVAKLESELQKKRTGLLDVMAEREQFRLSQQYYQDLTVVMDAVRHSCNASMARR